MSEVANFCVIGAAGLIGIRHTNYIVEDESLNLSCIIEPSKAGEDLSKKLNIPRYMSIAELIKERDAGNVKVDGAIIATPNKTHVPMSLELLNAGISVLVEKPMSTDIESGRQLVEATKAAPNGAKVLVGHHRRFNPYILAVKEIVDSNDLGQILAVNGTWACKKADDYFEGSGAWRKSAETGGVVLINLAHEIDCLRYLLGDIVRVYCEKGISTRGFEAEETGAVTIKFRSGTVGVFTFSDASVSPWFFESATGENPHLPQSKQSTYTFLGTKGSTSFPDLKKWTYGDKVDGNWNDVFVQGSEPKLGTTPPIVLELRHFADVCKGRSEPNCNASEGFKVITTLEAVLESMRTCKPVDVLQE